MANKKELILDGLSCPSCSEKIECEVKKISNLNDATLNFIEKTLTINYDDESLSEKILKETYQIINRIEPDVVVKEKTLYKNEKKILIVTGLCCSECSLKVEKEITLLDGVASAMLDYTTGKLAIEILPDYNTNKIIKEANKTGKKIIEKIKIRDEDRALEKHKVLNRFRMSLGVVLYGTALFMPASEFIKTVLFVVSFILIGSPVIISAVRNLLRGDFFDENFLMSIATIGAFALKEYPEAVAVMLFYQIGEMLQDMAVNHSRQSIKSLLNMRPEFANLVKGNDTVKVSPYEIKAGDNLIVKPGEKVPVDGVIIKGESFIDTRTLTGESKPRAVGAGEYVLSGSIVTNGLLTVRAEKIFTDSTISKIMGLIESSAAKKSKTENFITKFAKIYTPFVVISALLIATVPPLLFNIGEFGEWFYKALIFLVVSCPCALVLSIPLGFFGGIGRSSKEGILIKGSNYLEALNHVDTVVFDKTGTLTKGSFKVEKIVSSPDFSEDEILHYVSYAESYSNHPIAESIIARYNKPVDKSQVDKVEEISGMGLLTRALGRNIAAGNDKLMERENIRFIPSVDNGTIVYCGVDGVYAGYIVINDEIKEESRDIVRLLKKSGIKRTVILSGDNKKTADYVGELLGFDEVYSDLLPEDKVRCIENIIGSKKDGKVMFVGDGINDAPVIVRSDIGVAMGLRGADAAIESADVIITNDNLLKIPSAFSIASKTQSIVIQNIVLSLAVKAIVLILGAGGLATMWEAVFADVGVALLAVLNSLRILRSRT